MTPEHFRTLGRYNRWANRRLYDACALLDDAEYRKRRPAFFGSIHGTLNHLLVGDRVWLGRIERVPSGIERLDQILYDDFAALRDAREAEDARILALVDRLDETALAQDLNYANMAGAPQRTRLDWVLMHFFNHQTHHRGQAHGLLSHTAVPPPPLDLIFFLREAAAAA
ncbi:MAG TPA: DinB family protein [Alphaproteobacteria bacterium]|nr:DinB family protein [Alphaproteobacteria bacterium]